MSDLTKESDRAQASLAVALDAITAACRDSRLRHGGKLIVEPFGGQFKEVG